MKKKKENLTNKEGDFVQPIVSRREICPSHKPLYLGYVSWEIEAERRLRKGMKQKQCEICKRWLWKDEM